MKDKLNLLLIYGGRGLEAEISAVGAENLFPYLISSLDVIPVFIDKKGTWLTARERPKDRLPFTSELTKVISPVSNSMGKGILYEDGSFEKTDIALPLLHGDFGEDGSIQGMLETLGIPFFGCKAVESCVCYDKIYAKLIAKYLKIPTVKWISATDLSFEDAERMAQSSIGYPMFIKPARLGSSFGASVVKNKSDFQKSYEKAKELGGGKVLIEELVKIEAELECVYFGSKSKELFTKIGDIRYKSDFYDYDAKYKSEGTALVSALSPYEERFGDILRSYSKKLKDFIGIRDLARFDFFLDREGRLFFNEINTVPGFTKSSLAPRLIEISGEDLKKSFEQLLTQRSLEA